MTSRFVLVSVVGLGLVVAACGSPEPRAIHYGEEVCDYCHMTIADPTFAAQLVTTTGKVHVFDDAGDLAAFSRAGHVREQDIHDMWVNLFLHPTERVTVDEAVFLRSERLRTPMSSGLAAFRLRVTADSMRAVLGGEVLGWSDVVRLADSSSTVTVSS